ncbi:DUF4097 family beta strand repeat-containing protein [Dyadobacter sp. CY326]|uniref:DUF4097 family beta strand repeat-containing protein n=1 Tax=Dyadobacter sp. CY326 TaxID=2907300 RepID=UPI001F410DA7|nr:DUF4097 family beta strand repeat-containing protein [Dyadobacter sp. CY326]MCE7065937.1 DUF4097 domain-containing protein [Dyadobacter sp. CY326]
MKTIRLIGAGLLCLALSANAQEYKTKLPAGAGKVTFEMGAGDVKIEGHGGDDVIITASSGYEGPPERAKGLKPIYYAAVDNSGIGLAVTPEAGGLKIEKATRKSVKYTVKLPKRASILYTQTNWQGGSAVSISNVDGDLEVRTNNADIDLNNVTGPVVANTTSGEIKALFSNLNQQKPTAISSISGVVDVSLPAVVKSNLKLRSINGEMFTDFDLGIKSTKDGMSKVGGGSNIEGTINGGGVEMNLHTISGNIYIRKQK